MASCGNCRYGRPIPTQLTHVACHGLPPQLVVLPGARGQTINMLNPNMPRVEPACALHQPKLVWPLHEVSEGAMT